MRILFVGDVFGQPGREAIEFWLPRLRRAWGLAAIVVNGENSAQSGRGITPSSARTLLAAGADVITGGNHSFRCREIEGFCAAEPRLLRPLNWRDASAPGHATRVVSTAMGNLLVLQVQGQLFMPRQTSCPFAALDRELGPMPGRQPILLDVHAEASSEKQALAWHVAGRVSAVLGTHTHVPTADARILAGHTAYQTDVGMCGPYDSIIGSDTAGSLRRFHRAGAVDEPLLVASGDVRLAGAAIDIEPAGGAATGIWPVQLPYSNQGTPGAPPPWPGTATAARGR